MIKTVIFDLGGVLIDVDIKQCFKNIKALGVDIDALSSYDTTEAASTLAEGIKSSGIVSLYQVGKISSEDFIATILKHSKKGTTPQQVIGAWNTCLMELPDYKLQFIKDLRNEGYNTYLLSNTNEIHWKYVIEHSLPEPVENYFTKTFLSQEMHLAKPSDEIYEEVLRQIGSPANECLFLDDSLANCIAAEKHGIHTYHTPIHTDFRAEVRKRL